MMVNCAKHKRSTMVPEAGFSASGGPAGDWQVGGGEPLTSYLVPEAGFEPAQSNRPRDFKSLASTNSATPAY